MCPSSKYVLYKRNLIAIKRVNMCNWTGNSFACISSFSSKNMSAHDQLPGNSFLSLCNVRVI